MIASPTSFNEQLEAARQQRATLRERLTEEEATFRHAEAVAQRAEDEYRQTDDALHDALRRVAEAYNRETRDAAGAEVEKLQRQRRSIEEQVLQPAIIARTLADQAVSQRRGVLRGVEDRCGQLEAADELANRTPEQAAALVDAAERALSQATAKKDQARMAYDKAAEQRRAANYLVEQASEEARSASAHLRQLQREEAQVRARQPGGSFWGQLANIRTRVFGAPA